MKRTLTIILIAALLLSTLIFPLTSCSETDRLSRMDEEKRAIRLFELAEETARNAEALRVRQTVLVKNPHYNSSYTETVTVARIEGEDDLTYIHDSQTYEKLGDTKILTHRKTGYAVGMAFTYNAGGGVYAQFKSPTDADTYRARLDAEQAEQPVIRVGDGYCETVTSEQNEDGTWTATYENFTETGMAPILRMVDGNAYLLTDTHDLDNIRMTLTVDESLRPTRIKIEFLFHESMTYPAAKPSVTLSWDFIAWDAASIDEKVDLSEYTEIHDLAVPDAFFDALEAREQASKGEFTVETVTTAEGQGATQTGVLTQRVTYANAGGYRFTLDYGQGDGRYEMTYAGGDAFLTVYDGSGRKTEIQSLDMIDAQARMTVNELMNPLSISRADVLTAELVSEGTGLYRYTLGAGAERFLTDTYKALYPENTVAITSFSGQLDAKIKDGVMGSYTIALHAELTVDGVPVTSDSSITVTFTE